MLTCSKCGELVKNGENFCSKCGNCLTMDKKKTSKPIAAGTLLIIAASLCLIVGFIYLYSLLIMWSYISYSLLAGTPEVTTFYFVIGVIFDFWAFAIGLAGGIFSIKRTHFPIAIIGSSFVIVAACISIVFFFITIPILILGILSAVFIAISKKEFT